jgi:hypothetical protein
MHIEISIALEVLVDRHGGNAADAEDCGKQVRAGTKMRHRAKELSSVALGLNGIVLRAISQKLNALCLYFKGLLILRRQHHRSNDLYACPNSNFGDGVKILKSIIVNDLQILEK